STAEGSPRRLAMDRYRELARNSDSEAAVAAQAAAAVAAAAAAPPDRPPLTPINPSPIAPQGIGGDLAGNIPIGQYHQRPPLRTCADHAGRTQPPTEQQPAEANGSGAAAVTAVNAAATSVTPGTAGLVREAVLAVEPWAEGVVSSSRGGDRAALGKTDRRES
ncbi:unnamed protein product, partial [Sphacelaria rigidula]